MDLTPLDLSKNQFKIAKTLGFRYVGVRVEMDGYPKPEIIINPEENIDKKLEYYKLTYDADLNHKHAKGIRITNFTIGNNLEEIEEDLLEINK